MAIVTTKQRCSARYLKLIKRYPLRPIRSEAELDVAISVLNTLLDRPKLAQDEKDYRDVLGDLIHQFESEYYPPEPVSDAEMLRHLIEAKEATQASVAKDCEIAESTISAILAGSRKPTRNHIAKFARHFHVSQEVFCIDE